jgi:hypothetical protein
MINFHSIICNQHLKLPLFAYAKNLKEKNINQYYAVFHLQQKFGFSEARAKLIAELAGFNSNQWGQV